MRFNPALFVALLCTAATYGHDLFEKRAAQCDDNCGRAVAGTRRGAAFPSTVSADCSSYFGAIGRVSTVSVSGTPSPVIATVLVTVTTTSTISTTATSSATTSVTTSTTTETTIISSVTSYSTSTVPSTVTVLTTVDPDHYVARRAVAQPSYASSCTASGQFSSACSCAGITASTTTVTTGATAVTTSATSISLASATQVTTVSTVTSTLTSTITEVVTSSSIVPTTVPGTTTSVQTTSTVSSVASSPPAACQTVTIGSTTYKEIYQGFSRLSYNAPSNKYAGHPQYSTTFMSSSLCDVIARCANFAATSPPTAYKTFAVTFFPNSAPLGFNYGCNAHYGRTTDIPNSFNDPGQYNPKNTYGFTTDS